MLICSLTQRKLKLVLMIHLNHPLQSSLSMVEKEQSSGANIDYSIAMLQKHITALNSYIQTEDFKRLSKEVRKKFRSQVQDLNNGYRILMEARDE